MALGARENVEKGKFYRYCSDAANKIWNRVSFWTASEDVELSNGTRLEAGIIDNLDDINANTKTNMVAGANALKTLSNNLMVSDGSGTMTIGDMIKALYDDKFGSKEPVSKLIKVGQMKLQMGTNTLSVVSKLDNFKDLTIDNFLFNFISANGIYMEGDRSNISISSRTYTASSGEITVVLGRSGNIILYNVTVDVYAIL